MADPRALSVGDTSSREIFVPSPWGIRSYVASWSIENPRSATAVAMHPTTRITAGWRDAWRSALISRGLGCSINTCVPPFIARTILPGTPALYVPHAIPLCTFARTRPGPARTGSRGRSPACGRLADGGRRAAQLAVGIGRGRRHPPDPRRLRTRRRMRPAPCVARPGACHGTVWANRNQARRHCCGQGGCRYRRRKHHPRHGGIADHG